MARLDPETYQPYHYAENDLERHEMLDTTVSNPGWMREMHDSAPCSDSADEERLPTPPDRAAFAHGEDGQQKFRDARADYYFSRTGQSLEGDAEQPRSLAEQNELFHNLTRDFRVRSDR